MATCRKKTRQWVESTPRWPTWPATFRLLLLLLLLSLSPLLLLRHVIDTLHGPWILERPQPPPPCPNSRFKPLGKSRPTRRIGRNCHWTNFDSIACIVLYCKNFYSGVWRKLVGKTKFLPVCDNKCKEKKKKIQKIDSRKIGKNFGNLSRKRNEKKMQWEEAQDTSVGVAHTRHSLERVRTIVCSSLFEMEEGGGRKKTLES